MRKNNHIPSEELLKAIDRYFDCDLSDEEEKELMRLLAATDSTHPSVLEAKALMGFRTIKEKNIPENGISPSIAAPRLRLRPSLLKITGAAAAVAIFVALGIFLTNRGVFNTHDNECIAYINGQRITDEETVMNLLLENINELDCGAEEADRLVLDELNDLAPLAIEVEYE